MLQQVQRTVALLVDPQWWQPLTQPTCWRCSGRIAPIERRIVDGTGATVTVMHVACVLRRTAKSPGGRRRRALLQHHRASVRGTDGSGCGCGTTPCCDARRRRGRAAIRRSRRSRTSSGCYRATLQTPKTTGFQASQDGYLQSSCDLGPWEPDARGSESSPPSATK